MRMLKHLAKKGYWAASMDVGANVSSDDRGTYTDSDGVKCKGFVAVYLEWKCTVGTFLKNEYFFKNYHSFFKIMQAKMCWGIPHYNIYILWHLCRFKNVWWALFKKMSLF